MASKGNPQGWKPIKAPHIPIGGYEYRAVSDGNLVLIQKKPWRDSIHFRTKVRIPTEAWKSFEASLTGKTDYEAAQVLARLARTT